MRPARKALRPAITASRMASAMSGASAASAMAVFISRPSAPSSIAIAASDAVPTPASTIMRDFGDAFAEDAEIRGILDAEAGADGRGEGHHGGGASVDELAGGDEIVVGVRKHDEAFVHQNLCGLNQLFGVGEERFLVADHFELHPVGEANFAGQTRGADGFVGGVAGGGVGKNEDFFAIDVVEQGFLGFIGEVDAANGDGDHVRAGGDVRAGHFGEAAVFASTDDEAGVEGTASDDELIGHGVVSEEDCRTRGGLGTNERGSE